MVSHRFPLSPLSVLAGPFHYPELLINLVKRDFMGRYQGSILGAAWALFNPLLMLAVYTMVFSAAFHAHWGTGEEGQVAFALILFFGLVVHGFFAECINRAPLLITGHTCYVKKVLFPLEILPWMALCSALLHFMASFGVLLIFCLLSGVAIHVGVLLVPIVLLPLFLITLGVVYLLASLGVYLRDLAQGVNMITTITLFLSPVFYPMSALPDAYRWAITLNPVTLPIIQLRDTVLWDKPLQWDAWVISLATGAVICHMGFWWFQKARQGFADVL